MSLTRGYKPPTSENVIRITTRASGTTEINKRVVTANPFFEGELIVSKIADKLIFRKPTIDYRGKTVKAVKACNLYTFRITADALNGDYELDREESTEDQKVIYLN